MTATKQQTVRITSSLKIGLVSKISAQATTENRSLSQMIAILLQEAIDKRKKS